MVPSKEELEQENQILRESRNKLSKEFNQIVVALTHHGFNGEHPATKVNDLILEIQELHSKLDWAMLHIQKLEKKDM